MIDASNETIFSFIGNFMSGFIELSINNWGVVFFGIALFISVVVGAAVTSIIF